MAVKDCLLKQKYLGECILRGTVECRQPVVNSDPNAKKRKGKNQKEVKRKQVQQQDSNLLITKISVLAPCLS